MIDERELAAALNRAIAGLPATGLIPIYTLYNILKTISGRHVLWTYHNNSPFKFRVQKINPKEEL